MRSYGQYCPIVRAAEVLGERWTLVILRNLLLGCTTFTEIADGAPGMSRTLLTTRLRQLERAGLVTRVVGPGGRTVRYELTGAGTDLWDVVVAIGNWGERWLELAPEHLDPFVVLWSWCRNYLDHSRLPEERVVIRFEFAGQARARQRFWFVVDGGRSEVCRTHPGFEEDLVVEAEPQALAEWHLGRVEWGTALRDERIRVTGPRPLARQLPTWNRRSTFAGVAPAVSR